MTAHACRTTCGNYINCIRCANRLREAYTHTWSSSRDYISFSFTDLFADLASRQQNDHTAFESLPPMSITPMLNLHMIPLMLNFKQESCEYQFLKSVGMARPGNEPRSTDCKEDALTTTPPLLPLHHHGSIKRCKTGKPQCTNNDKQKNDRPEQQALVLLRSKFC